MSEAETALTEHPSKKPAKGRGKIALGNAAQIAVANAKVKFVKALQTNGGNVSGALRTSGLKRVTAYEHFKIDREFADTWLDALEMSQDDLVKEARRRATKGVKRPVYQGGEQVGTVTEYSDTLLIFLLKQGEAQKKWRNRIVQTGNIALECVREAGTKAGLTEEQVTAIQRAMTEKFEKVSLI